MSTQARTISTTAHFTVTDATGRESVVYRELALIEKGDGGWVIRVGEPDTMQDDPEGELVSSGMVMVPVEASATLDDLFALVADLARVGARTR